MCGQFCTLCGRCALVAGRDAPMKIIPCLWLLEWPDSSELRFMRGRAPLLRGISALRERA